MAQSLGIVEIIWRGTNIPIQKGAKFILPGFKNNSVVAGRKAYRSQEYAAGKATATTVLARGTSYGSLYDEGEGELQIRCDTGHVYTCPEAFLQDGPPEISDDGGKLELSWAISTYEEILS